MRDWIAFYVKPLCQSGDYPLDHELHGWECKGKTPAQAIEDLEKDPNVPFHIFFVDIVPSDQAPAWIASAEAEAKELRAQFSYHSHRRDNAIH